MANIIKKKCPHCGHVYRSYSEGTGRLYGCPLVFCSECNQGIWDSDIKEPALYGYEKEHPVLFFIGFTYMFLFSLAMLIISIVFTIKGESSWIIGIVLGGLACFVFGFFIAIGIQDVLFPEKKQLQQQQEYDASKERLQNTVYLTALAEHDSLAKKLLAERMNGKVENYAARPEVKKRKENYSSKEKDKPVVPVLQKNEKQIAKGNSPEVKSQEELLNSIEKMKKMCDAGILTQEEFETKKSDLLSRL